MTFYDGNNQDEVIKWIEEALINEGVSEEDLNKHSQYAIIEDESMILSRPTLSYEVNDWWVKSSARRTTFYKKRVDNDAYDEHRVKGPSSAGGIQARYLQHNKAVLFPSYYLKVTYEETSTIQYSFRFFHKENWWLTLSTVDGTLSEAECTNYVLFSNKVKEIAEYLMKTFSLTLGELLLHPNETIRKITEESIESK